MCCDPAAPSVTSDGCEAWRRLEVALAANVYSVIAVLFLNNKLEITDVLLLLLTQAVEIIICDVRISLAPFPLSTDFENI